MDRKFYPDADGIRPKNNMSPTSPLVVVVVGGGGGNIKMAENLPDVYSHPIPNA